MAQVLSAQTAHEGSPYFSSSPLLHPSASQTSLFATSSPFSLSRDQSPSRLAHGKDAVSASTDSSAASASPPTESSLSRTPSFRSTPPSSISLETQLSNDDEDDIFPSYDNDVPKSKPSFPAPSSNPESDVPATPDTLSSITEDSEASSPFGGVVDDTAVRQEPSSQVDYLSHEWKEEDIWSSWKHIVSQRRVYGERSRLENASWRTWTKQKYRLKTVSPETLNWLKDCDVTWLYGPLQHGHGVRHSEPSSHLSKCNSFLNKKPILKKRSVSEVMLQKSISSSSLVKQAAAAVQAQRRSYSTTGSHGPTRLKRSASDFITACNMPSQPIGTAESSRSSAWPSSTSSGLQSPDPSGGKHIRFDTKVEQCIAVDFKEGGAEDESSSSWTRSAPSADSSDDEMPIMKPSNRRRPSRTSSSRSSFSGESKGIVKLPSTTLKSHNEEIVEQNYFSNQFASHSARIMSSPSQETLRPSKASDSFLLGTEPADEPDWEPAGAFSNLRRDSISGFRDNQSPSTSALSEDGGEPSAGLRRTPSGMFMPFDDDDEQSSLASTGIIGRVVDTVNTAKDIAHVIWNVGWRK